MTRIDGRLPHQARPIRIEDIISGNTTTPKMKIQPTGDAAPRITCT